MNIIDLFHRTVDELNSRFRQTKHEEDLHEVRVTFTEKSKGFKDFVQTPWFDDAINNNYLEYSISYFNGAEEAVLSSYHYRKFSLPDEQSVAFELLLNKQRLFSSSLDNVLLFIKLEAFTSMLFSHKLDEFLDPFDNKSVIYLPVNSSYENSVLTILPNIQYTQCNTKPISEETKKKLLNVKAIREQIARGEQSQPTPFSFYFNEDFVVDCELKKSIDIAFVLTVMKHISNRSDNNTYLVKGYKDVEIIHNGAFAVAHVDEFYSLFEFVYDPDKFLDKSEIARNVLTLYLNEKSELSSFDTFLPKMYGTILNHFTAYLQDKIKTFFDQYKDVENEAFSAAVKANEQSDKIITDINRTILGIITAVLTGIYSLIKGSTLLFVLALTLHAVYFIATYFVNASYARSKKNDIIDQYDFYTKQFNVIMREEQQLEIKQKYIDPAINRLDRTLHMYTIFSIIVITLVTIVAALTPIWNKSFNVNTFKGSNTTTNSTTLPYESHTKPSSSSIVHKDFIK